MVPGYYCMSCEKPSSGTMEIFTKEAILSGRKATGERTFFFMSAVGQWHPVGENKQHQQLKWKFKTAECRESSFLMARAVKEMPHRNLSWDLSMQQDLSALRLTVPSVNESLLFSC